MKRYANKVFTPVVLLMLVVFTTIISLSLRQAAESRTTSGMVAHTQDVLIQVSKIVTLVTDNEARVRGYLITGDRTLLQPLDLTKKNIYEQIGRLRELTVDNNSQQARILQLETYAKQRFDFLDSAIAVSIQHGSPASMAIAATEKGKIYLDQMRETAAEMQHEEDRLLESRKADHDHATTFLNRTMASIVVVIVALIIILLRKDYLAIAGRQAAETALKKTETSFELMTNSVKDYAIIMLDKDGIIQTWNKGAKLVTGYEKEEGIGKPISILYSQAEIEKEEPKRQLALAKKYGQYEIEGMLLRKEKETFWANTVLIALVNPAGEVTGYSAIVHDITERKNTQEQLEFLSLQINQSNDAVFVIDRDRKIKSWNRGAERLYGYQLGEMLDKDPNQVLKTELTPEEFAVLLEKLSRDNYWTGELKRFKKNGDVIYVRSSTTTIRDSNGEITGFVGVSIDITEEKKLREEINHLANLVEQSEEAIISVNASEEIISWNAGAEKLFGYNRGEALGQSATAIKLSDNEASLSSAIQHVFQQGSFAGEMQFRKNDKKTFTGSINANSIRNEKGELYAIVLLVNDITSRKELERQLIVSNEELEQRVAERTKEITKNEQKFRALIENSAEGIALLDAEGNVMYRSPGAYKIAGNVPLGNRIGAIHPDDLEHVKAKGAESRKHPEVPVAFQGRFQNDRGEYDWMEGTLTNLLHIDAVNAIVANYRNITKRKLAEEKLAASEKQFRYTLDHMLEGVQIIGFDWRYIYVNDALSSHAKYSKEQLIGHSVMELYPGIETTPLFKLYEKCFNERATIHMENEFVYPDKSVAWFELSFQPVPEGIFILSVDITDRKKAEERLVKSEQLYRSLFENMLHGFAYCRGIFEHGKLVDYIHLGVNKEFEAVTGLHNVVSKKLSELLPGVLEHRPIYAEMIGRVAMNGKTEKFEIYAEPFKKWLSVSLYSPEKEYFVILVDNITERKQTEQKIKKLNADLEQRVIKRTEQLKKTNEELEAFSYSVSHDLRAPLRAIIGFTAILEDEYSDKLDEEARRITSIIKSNTLRMGHLIDDLLTFSRMGRQDLVKSHINTDELIREIISQPDIRQYTNEHPVKWLIHDLPNVDGDLNTIRQVWVNLISNAVKYSGKVEQPKIEIGSYHENGNIIFFVKDNGVGFDEQYKNKLFRVFQRLHTADEFEGTGIGLAIVEKIVSKHDGKVWADGEVDGGACFFFSLPEVPAPTFRLQNDLINNA